MSIDQLEVSLCVCVCVGVQDWFSHTILIYIKIDSINDYDRTRQLNTFAEINVD